MTNLTKSGMPKGKPFPENELVWIDCPECEYHVRVHQSTQEANMRQHKEKGCPLVTTGDEIPEVENRNPLELQAPLCPEPCGNACTCLPDNWNDGLPLAPATSPEPISRKDSPKVEPTSSHSWEPLRRALSDEEKYAGYLAKRNKVERHPNSARFHEILTELGDLHDKKQADYGRGDDPFANVRSSEEWGISSWVGAMVRLNDKVRRLQSLASKGDLMNEAAEDSFRDIAVYSIIALVLYEQGLADEGQYR